MILVPKAPQMPSFNHLSTHSSHRRAATALVVPHPHRTPGLLAIQTPPKATQTKPFSGRQSRSSHIQRKEKPEVPTVTATADDVFTAPSIQSTDIHQRGRTPNPNSNSNKRPSHRSSSQTPAPADRAPISTTPPPPARDQPLLTSQPSGRLARSRRNRNSKPNNVVPGATPTPAPFTQVNAPPSPSPQPRATAASIPVPKPKRAQNADTSFTLSRSAPSLSQPHIVPRQNKRNKERRSKPHTAPTSGVDEQTDSQDASFIFEDSLPISDWDMPPTPPANRYNAATWSPAQGRPQTPPRTAPLNSSAFGAYPFPTSSSTPPIRRNHVAHARSPSFPLEALFASLKLENSFPLVEEGTSDEDGTLPANMTSAFYRRYANSKFQNSPSPSELPKPKFLGGMAMSEDLFGPF